MRRNLFVSMLGLMMALMLCVPGMAQGAVDGSFVIDTYDVSLNEMTGTIAVADYDANCYVLMDASGNRLTTTAYQYMSPSDSGFQVAMEDGLNNMGYIDGQGKELVPMQYGDIEYVSENWQLGVVLEEATAENYDYQSFGSDGYYLVAAYDVYFQGQKIGSLSRMEYDYAYAYGKYLYVCDREDNSAYYDSSFQKSSYTDGNYYDEYNYNYDDGSVWHCGSGQQAFTVGCTLTSEDVEQDLYEKDGIVLDLQGNVVFELARGFEFYSEFYGDYAVIYAENDKYGIVDRTGTIVVKCAYDEIDYYDGIFVGGYQVAVKDGKVGYIDASGNETCEFKYNESNFDFLTSPLSGLQDMEGMSIVLSAAAGELPQRYAEVDISYTNGCPAFCAMDAEGNVGVVDMYGNVIIPFDGAYDSIYDISISDDGSVITAYNGDSGYTVYSVSYSAGEAPVAEETAAEAEESVEAPSVMEEKKAAMKQAIGDKADGNAEEAAEETAEDAGWTCSCGAVNNSNFCSECGSARPAEEVVCKNCGYKPEGDAPNFCPECGTKF